MACSAYTPAPNPSPSLHVAETPIIAIARDAEGARHQLTDDAGDVLAMLLFIHAVLRRGRRDDVFDHGARRVQLLSVLDRDAELLLDVGEEFVESPTHPGSVDLRCGCATHRRIRVSFGHGRAGI